MTTIKNYKPDAAAVMGIAVSLHEAAKKAKGNISEAYNGADQFMRECMRVGEFFETWADQWVDFDQMDDVWPYMLEDKFGQAVIEQFGSVLFLTSFDDVAARAVARELGLKLRQEPARPAETALTGAIKHAIHALNQLPNRPINGAFKNTYALITHLEATLKAATP